MVWLWYPLLAAGAFGCLEIPWELSLHLAMQSALVMVKPLSQKGLTQPSQAHESVVVESMLSCLVHVGADKAVATRAIANT